jgi:TorA maturation chaperone TorD
MKTVYAGGALEQAIGRSAVYGLLAQALAFPHAGQGAAITELLPALAALPGMVAGDADELAGSLPEREVLAVEYARLFTHSTSRDCPPFETAYAAKEIFQQTQQMADIAGFYRAFGVEVTPGGERVDHICAELEFMQLLAAKEAYAYQHMGAARVRQCRKAQRLFLRDHLACWGPGLGRRLAMLDRSGWYGRAGRLLAGWLEEECRALDVTPVQTTDTPVLPWPEPDEEGPADSPFLAEAIDCDGCPAIEADGATAGVSGFIPLSLIEK